MIAMSTNAFRSVGMSGFNPTYLELISYLRFFMLCATCCVVLKRTLA